MTKVVIIDRNDEICASVIKHTGAEHRRLANTVMEEALEQAGVSFDEISYVIATGYGRITVPFADRQITELTCHARGVYHYVPSAKLAIDIGGQDAKGLKMSCGKLLDFVMSDKCAAGTGRFLENTSSRLAVQVERMGDEALSTSEEVSISSTCTVFAESEIVSLLAHGVPVPAILRGLHRSLVKRVLALIRSVGLENPLMLSGGVVKNPAIRYMLAEETGEEIILPEFPQLMGAYGAALIALND